MHPSRCSRSTLITVCFCFCSGVPESSVCSCRVRRSIVGSSPSSCSEVRDPWSCGIPILQFEQHCSAGATIGFFLTFAQFFSFCQSVPSYPVRHASLVQIRIHQARSLARTLAKCFVASAKSNLSWANQFAPCCANLIQNQTQSSNVASCNITRLFRFESLNPGVPPCRSLRLGLQTLKVILYCPSHILM